MNAPLHTSRCGLARVRPAKAAGYISAIMPPTAAPLVWGPAVVMEYGSADGRWVVGVLSIMATIIHKFESI